MVAGVFHGREGIGLATDGVEFLGDLIGTALLGALEDHVFDEMGETVFPLGLIAGTDIDPHAHGDGVHVGHPFGQDFDAVG